MIKIVYEFDWCTIIWVFLCWFQTHVCNDLVILSLFVYFPFPVHFSLAAPFSPPITITGQNLSSTSLRLQWKPVPYEYARGIILGYKIIVLGYRLGYQNVSNDTSWNVTIDNENILQHVFSSFEMFTDYTFQMLAFTIKGEGNVSMLLTVRTDEDSE